MNLHNPLISIIVPVYNSAKTISYTLDSLLMQNCNKEILLIDDGSTDSSLEIMQEYENRYSEIKVYSKVNSGVSDTRNLGIKLSKGDYLIFVDSDDLLEEDALEECLNHILNTDIDVVVFSYKICDSSYNTLSTFSYKKSGLYNIDSWLADWNKLYMTNILSCIGTKLYKSKIIKENDLYFDTSLSFFEDYIFCFNYFKHVNKLYYIDAFFYNYIFINTTSLSRGYKINYPKCLFTMLQVEDDLLSTKKIDIERSKLLSQYRIDFINAIENEAKNDSIIEANYNMKLLNSKAKKLGLLNNIFDWGRKYSYFILLNKYDIIPFKKILEVKKHIKKIINKFRFQNILKHFYIFLENPYIFINSLFQEKGIIIMYHNITDKDLNEIPCCVCKIEKFKTQILNLYHEYEFISVNDIYNSYKKKIAVITFDDATKNVFENAYPFLKAKNIPFAVFVSSSLLGKPGYISDRELEIYNNDPLVTIGFHTNSHSELFSCQNVFFEICESKSFLEQKINKNINIIAYPYGKLAQVGLKSIMIARQTKYKMAFGTFEAPLTRFSLKFKFFLPRIPLY